MTEVEREFALAILAEVTRCADALATAVDLLTDKVAKAAEESENGED